MNLLAAIGQIVAMSSGGWIAERWGPQATFWASALLSVPALAAFALIRDVRAPSGAGLSMRAFGRAISNPRLLLVAGLAACSQFAFFATTLGYAAVGTLFSTMAVNTRAREGMLPILLLPVSIPVFIPAVNATGAFLAGDALSEAASWLRLLLAYDAIIIAVSFMTFDFVVEE